MAPALGFFWFCDLLYMIGISILLAVFLLCLDLGSSAVLETTIDLKGGENESQKPPLVIMALSLSSLLLTSPNANTLTVLLKVTC